MDITLAVCFINEWNRRRLQVSNTTLITKDAVRLSTVWYSTWTMTLSYRISIFISHSHHTVITVNVPQKKEQQQLLKPYVYCVRYVNICFLSRRKHPAYITKSTQLILHEEVQDIYFEGDKHTNTLNGKDAESPELKSVQFRDDQAPGILTYR